MGLSLGYDFEREPETAQSGAEGTGEFGKRVKRANAVEDTGCV